MAQPQHFKSGRTGPGNQFTADRHGALHARFMRLSSYALAPLGGMSAWWLANMTGKPLDKLREEISHPVPALVLIAFAVIGMVHAREGMNEIILDYVHDQQLRDKALCANKWAALAISGIWVLAIMFIAAPR